jgi:uncharacterized protein YjiS (DUF1127 family)
MTTQTVSSHRASLHEVSLHDNVFGGLQFRRPRQWLIKTLLEWRRRAASRRELARLSAFDLKDIGYPDHTAAEIAKPFWRE